MFTAAQVMIKKISPFKSTLADFNPILSLLVRRVYRDEGVQDSLVVFITDNIQTQLVVTDIMALSNVYFLLAFSPALRWIYRWF